MMKKTIILILLGIATLFTLFAAQEAELGIAKIEGDTQIIKMSVDRYGWHPNIIVIQKDIPVHWEIEGNELNSCNDGIIAEDFDLKFSLKDGKQMQQFTPLQSGEYKFSCHMDMIPGKFIVVDNLKETDMKSLRTKANVDVSEDALPECNKCGSCPKK
jgi:plastocyanin domain-containing protein